MPTNQKPRRSSVCFVSTNRRALRRWKRGLNQLVTEQLQWQNVCACADVLHKTLTLHNWWDTSACSWCQCISGLPTYWRAPWCDPCSVDKVWFWWEIKMVEKERRALQYSVWNTIQLELPFWRDLFWVLIILGWHLMQGIKYSWYLLKTVFSCYITWWKDENWNQTASKISCIEFNQHKLYRELVDKISPKLLRR